VTRWLLIVVAISIGALGCIGISPEERAQHALPSDPRYDDDDGDEEHRPGQPCLVCHREDFHPGDDKFMAAGTIYETPESTEGLQGVQVFVRDAMGNTAEATTNSVGNFMFKKGKPEDDEKPGVERVPERFVYPLRIEISYEGGEPVVMESLSWREGSCAHCHTADGPGRGSEGRVYLREDPATVPPDPPVDGSDWAVHVQPYAERRCGTMDCHGDPGRPLRVYSIEGLRDSADRQSPLSAFEVEANEASARAVSPGADADSHAFLLEPLATAAGGWDHVGGEIWGSTDDPGYRCLRRWLEGSDPSTACAEAVASVPRGE